MQGFEDFWHIYEDSFPEDERRDKVAQRELLHNPKYRIVPYYKDDSLLAFVALWDLDDFLFIEHFAVKKDRRGNGYGTKILNDMLAKYKKNIVLEVEPPNDMMSKKRIEFYKRLGFYFNDYYYIQPPYTETQKEVQLYLMSYPIPITERKVNVVVDRIYKDVYCGKDPKSYVK